MYQGIQPANGLKFLVESNGATGAASEIAIKTTLGNRFMIPIDFELLKDIEPYYQAGIGDKLVLELTFNDPSAVILGSTSTDSNYNYQFFDINIEWDQITDNNLANAMLSWYEMLALPFKRFLYSKLDVEDVAKLTGYITASVIVIDYAKYKKWIPPSISYEIRFMIVLG